MSTDPSAGTERLYRAAVGPQNAEFYIPKFIRFDEPGASKVSWNWPAFFLSFCWFLYRRMYKSWLIYCWLIPFGLGIVGGISTAFFGRNLSNSFFALATFGYTYVVIPIFANSISIMTTYGSAFRNCVQRCLTRQRSSPFSRTPRTRMLSSWWLCFSCGSSLAEFWRQSRYPPTRTTRFACRWQTDSFAQTRLRPLSSPSTPPIGPGPKATLISGSRSRSPDATSPGSWSIMEPSRSSMARMPTVLLPVTYWACAPAFPILAVWYGRVDTQHHWGRIRRVVPPRRCQPTYRQDICHPSAAVEVRNSPLQGAGFSGRGLACALMAASAMTAAAPVEVERAHGGIAMHQIELD